MANDKSIIGLRCATTVSGVPPVVVEIAVYNRQLRWQCATGSQLLAGQRQPLAKSSDIQQKYLQPNVDCRIVRLSIFSSKISVTASQHRDLPNWSQPSTRVSNHPSLPYHTLCPCELTVSSFKTLLFDDVLPFLGPLRCHFCISATVQRTTIS